MNVIITVIGVDQVGILAKVATACAQAGANIIDVSQTLMENYFTMTMMVDINGVTLEFNDFKQVVKASCPSMQIHVMHEDIFQSMHQI
ncbi:ACT domain-containing protein [Hutsoniella sourekii]|uniref:ACT domain-containing protein n=1 Tax=Hutsoniella sourekii TaxID=87650 RepID=UPI0004832019|nr:ACT domain-containing protein [Hutsoniella sourekii]